MIDLDDVSTWPDAVRSWVDEWAPRLHGTTEYTSDLAVPLEVEREFRALFAGAKLLGDHFTRLLDHEVDRIITEGLEPLTAELLAARIGDARANGAIDADVAATLLEKNLVATGNGAERTGKTCFVIGRGGLDSSVAGCNDQVEYWGGEAIYRSSAAMKQLVRGIGRPAIVSAQVDVARKDVRTFPTLFRLFIGARLATHPAYGEMHVRGGANAADIVGIYRPGEPEYDRFAGLPRS